MTRPRAGPPGVSWAAGWGQRVDTCLSPQVRAHQLVLPPCDVVIKAVADYVRNIQDTSDLDAIAKDVFQHSQVGAQAPRAGLGRPQGAGLAGGLWPAWRRGGGAGGVVSRAPRVSTITRTSAKQTDVSGGQMDLWA